ncbi:MAG: single-stranded DNA-binding protein [Kiritimatiellae bacterium]|nr:single-stranded DNA-binding protein [Kiritimatiellia bacterium]
MMTTMNLVVLAGRLTRDPRLRTAGNGMSVADLGVAINERHRTAEGRETTRTCFVDVTVWQRSADACGRYLRKGACVLVEGRLATDQWTDEQGRSHSRLRVVAERVQFLDRPKHNGGANPAGQMASALTGSVPAPAAATRERSSGATPATCPPTPRN